MFGIAKFIVHRFFFFKNLNLDLDLNFIPGSFIISISIPRLK